MKSKLDHTAITETIIKAMENGVPPWKQSWISGHHNFVSQSGYRGINQLILMSEAIEKGFKSPYWITFNQARIRNGHILKGSKGTPIVFWKKIERKNPETGAVEMFPFMRIYNVFNLDQTAGLPRFTQSIEKTSLGTILDNYLKVEGISVEQGNPCYRPKTDTILMPVADAWTNPEHFYPTLAHECIHSTGHPSRLARIDPDNLNRFGTDEYAIEELRAELGTVFLQAASGQTAKFAYLDDSVSYLDHWVRVLRADPKILISTCGQAQRASDLILSKTETAVVVEEVFAEEEA